jgi:hypothetical protein
MDIHLCSSQNSNLCFQIRALQICTFTFSNIYFNIMFSSSPVCPTHTTDTDVYSCEAVFHILVVCNMWQHRLIYVATLPHISTKATKIYEVFRKT